MYFISDTAEKIESITAERIREIVAEDEFYMLATECGELEPGFVNANWLCFKVPEMKFAIEDDSGRNIVGLHFLATINAGVGGGEIEEECENEGIDGTADNFDSSGIIKKLFNEKCAEKNVTVVVPGQGSLSFDDSWEKEILELVTEIVQDAQDAQDAADAEDEEEN